MKSKLQWKWVILPLVLIGYASLYIATSYQKCDDACETYGRLNMRLRNGRPYVIGSSPQSQTEVLVVVDSVAGINWNLFADTVCTTLNQLSLRNRSVIVTNHRNNNTLATKTCP